MQKIYPLLLTALISLSQSSVTFACGGFFCDAVPIDQAAEQIVFRTEGDTTTAMVRILYTGDAERFSWVVPVPNTPELSVGSDQTFLQLDLATRPQFQLLRTGQSCEVFTSPTGTDGATTDGATAQESDSDVTVIEQSVGPFETQIVSSDNPDALAQWLTDNDYDLSDNGRNLIAPYVTAGMKFVALKLRNGQSTGSIQPLIMKYQTSTPMIPIRLTAVAAEDDMGVLVWFVANARAVPENYFHVTPNYTRLNWYTGSANAYASYQTLITEAMNEAGGQGFATDMAGRLDSTLLSSLTDSSFLEQQLATADGQNDADAIVTLISSGSSTAFQSAIPTLLPLPEGQDSSVYFSSLALQTQYTAAELATGLDNIRDAYVNIELEPLQDTLEQLPEGAYMTRLYTTLSADEMTLDPVFVFNEQMPDQSFVREATLNSNCTDNGTEWSLTLGAGTGREGETVIEAQTDLPFTVPPQVVDQNPTFRIERTTATELPETTSQANLPVALINTDGVTSTGSDDDNLLGSFGILSLLAGGIILLRRRKT